MKKFNWQKSKKSFQKELDQKFKKTKRAFKKEPLFCSIVISIVLTFIISVFGSNVALKNLGNFSFLAQAVNSNLPFAKNSSGVLTKSPDMSFISSNSLVAITPPASVESSVLGSLIGGAEDLDDLSSRTEIVEYEVEPGDSLSSVAAKFDISLDTILVANDLTSKSLIYQGQKLIILPVSGVIYNVKKGDTLSEIAKDYKGEVSEIVEINGLLSEGDIFIGDILVIPGGKIPVKKSTSYAQIPVGDSYFIPPVSKIQITQGLHWYNAIDFGAKCGEPVYASAAGAIQRTGYGYNGGAGNYVRILHNNGVVTMYGHLQTISVSPGQPVSQGEVIGLVGGRPGMAGAGKSTGCHVHFDVRGASNPFK